MSSPTSQHPPTSLSVTGPSPVSETPTLPPSSAEHFANLRYLKEHHVCERIEAMMRHVLTTRPEDPIMAMCNALRSNALRSSQDRGLLRASNNGVPGAGPFPVPMNPGALSESSVVGPGAATAAPSANSGSVKSVTSPPIAVAVPLDSSRRGSVKETFSRGGSASSHRIERDESAKSDVSGFSINSVDMGEFLSEFRTAHFSLFNGNAQMPPSPTSNDYGLAMLMNVAAVPAPPGTYITMTELGDIVDRVSLPLPDTRLLRDLFNELDTERTGRVPFEAFIARMNYRIQGRYHHDVLRQLFYRLAKVSQPQQTSPSSGAPPTVVAPCAGDAAVPAPAAYDLDDLEPEEFALAQELGATTSSARTKSSLGGKGGVYNNAKAVSISKAVCIEGLKWGLGITVTTKQLDEFMQRLGLGTTFGGTGAELHLLDFARLASALTSACVAGDAVRPYGVPQPQSMESLPAVD